MNIVANVTSRLTTDHQQLTTALCVAAARGGVTLVSRLSTNN